VFGHLWRETGCQAVPAAALCPECQCIIDDLLDLSAVEVEQDSRRALGLTLPPVFQEMQTDKASISAG
jgi:hypothetical protein